MTTKGKVILVLLGIALIVALIVPNFMGLPEDFNVVLAKLLSFLAISTILLCWIGVPAGWCFARDNGMGPIAVLVFALIGMYLSLPVAIIQLIKSMISE